MIELIYNSFDTETKPTEKHNFCVLFTLAFRAADVEQVTTDYDCSKKVLVQFLSPYTNWKGETLVKQGETNLFI